MDNTYKCYSGVGRKESNEMKERESQAGAVTTYKQSKDKMLCSSCMYRDQAGHLDSWRQQGCFPSSVSNTDTRFYFYKYCQLDSQRSTNKFCHRQQHYCNFVIVSSCVVLQQRCDKHDNASLQQARLSDRPTNWPTVAVL